MTVGSEAYAAAPVVYNHAKTSGLSAGLSAVVNEMGRRFGHKSRKTQKERKFNS